MIYSNIKTICKQKKIPVFKMENELGFSSGSVCKWNTSIPSVDKVKKVADYLNVTIERLLA